MLTPVGATLSSTYGYFVAANAIDGNTGTLAASLYATSTDQWLSVQVPAGSAIGRVDVYNRADNPTMAAWLCPYELWLGASAGALTYDCGGGSLNPPSCNTLGPFSTFCGGRDDLPYVTIILRSGTARLLTLGEVQVFAHVSHSPCRRRRLGARAAGRRSDRGRLRRRIGSEAAGRADGGPPARW